MTGWIIFGSIAMVFFVMAIFLINGKGAFLIAGYNTMSEEGKAEYDEKALCKAVGWFLLILTFLMLMWPISSHFGANWLAIGSTILFLALTIVFIIYINTGKRFRKPIDPNAPASTAAKQPMIRGKKVALIITIVVTVQICIATGVMFYRGMSDPVISVYRERIQISASYGTDIEISNISNITLLDRSMREIGIGTRTNGFDSGGTMLKGHFSSGKFGSHLLFVDSGSSPTIHIERVRGGDIFISFRNSENTIAAYNDMVAAIP